MSFSLFTEVMTPLLRATLVLSLVAGLILVMRYLTRESSPRANRFAWSVALVSGITWGGFKVEYYVADVSPLAPNMTIQPEFDPPQENSQIDTVSKRTLTADALDNRVSEPVLAQRDDRIQFDQQPHFSPIVAAPRTQRITTWQLIGVIWAIGVVVCVARNVFHYRRLLRQLRRAKLAEPVFRRQWDRAVTQVSGRSGIPMLITDSVGPAVVWTRHGYRLIVPGQRWRLMSHRGRRSVLLHEAAHVMRHDILWSLLARMVATVHWFNPLAWLAASRFDAAAEGMCDAIAAGGTRRLEFAQALLSLGQPNQRPLVASSGGQPLAARIQRLIGERPVSRKLPGLIMASLVVCVFLGANLRLIAVAQPPSAVDTSAPATSVEENSQVDSATRFRKVIGDRGFTMVAEPNNLIQSPDRRFFASNHQSSQSPIHIISAESGRVLRRLSTGLQRPGGYAQQMAFTSHSRELIAVIDGRLHHWDVPSGQRIGGGRLGTRKLASSIAVSPSGKYLAVGLQGRQVAVYESADLGKRVHLLQQTAEKQLAAATDPYGGSGAENEKDNIAFLDDTTLAWTTAGSLPQISTWDVQQGVIQNIVPLLGLGGAQVPKEVDYAIHRGDSVLIGSSWTRELPNSFTNSKRVRVLRLQQWNRETGELERELTDPPAFAEFRRPGRDRNSPPDPDPFRTWLETQPYAFGPWNRAAMSADQRFLVTSDRAQMHLWDLDTGKLVSRRAVPRATANGFVAISADGTIAYRESYNQIRRFTLPALSPVRRPTDGQPHPSSVSFSANDARVLTGHTDGSIRLWKAETTTQWSTKLTPQFSFTFLRPHVEYVKFLADGKRAVTATKVTGTDYSYQGEVSTVLLETGRVESSHRLRESIEMAELSPDETTIAIVGESKHLLVVKLLNLESGVIREVPGPGVLRDFRKIADIGFTQGGKSFWVVAYYGVAWEFDAVSGAKLREVKWNDDVKPGNILSNDPFFAGHLLNDARFIAHDRDFIHIWNLNTNEIERSIQTDVAIIRTGVSPDGKLVAGCSADSWVQESGLRHIDFWSIQTGEHLGRVAVEAQLPSELEFVPDGRLAGLHRDGTVKLYDVPGKPK